MTRRVHRLPVKPGSVPVQLVLGLGVGALVVVGKRAKAHRFVPGGSFPQSKAKAA